MRAVYVAPRNVLGSLVLPLQRERCDPGTCSQQRNSAQQNALPSVAAGAGWWRVQRAGLSAQAVTDDAGATVERPGVG